MDARIDYTELQHAIGIMEKRGRRVMGELAPAIAEGLVSEVLEVFETEGYGEWADYADSTLDRKLFGKRKSTSPKLLQDTGNLVGSITPAWDDDVAEAYTNVRYAKFHVTGTRYMPQRDFLAIDMEAYQADVADMILLRLDRPQAAE